MATAEQLKSLIRSHLNEDSDRFYTLALQVAAHEAQQGHSMLAQDIRKLLDKKKNPKPTLVKFPQDLSSMVHSESTETKISSIVLETTLQTRLDRVVHEYHQREKLKKHGLENRRKLLLSGPPGTGKTMTAKVLAHELRLPLHTIQVDRLVTKFMGETSAKLRLIFNLIRDTPGVYLFDEFDAIAGDRSLDNDVGEMRRGLNALLQFIEQDQSESLIIGATNTHNLIDKALFRRFDDVLHYDLPNEEARKRLITNLLSTFKGRLAWKQVMQNSSNLSHAEIVNACQDAIKQAILSNQSKVTTASLSATFKERQSTHSRD